MTLCDQVGEHALELIELIVVRSITWVTRVTRVARENVQVRNALARSVQPAELAVL